MGKGTSLSGEDMEEALDTKRHQRGFSSSQKVRVAFYGTGRFANRTHIPNLQRLRDVEIVALCDSDPQALATTVEHVPEARAYTDAYEMLESESFDVLYSCVPAYARTDVERLAVRRGIHLFSEKPQALTMALARAIDEAIQEAGVIGTVGFRERYRPIFQEAQRFLADKRIVHVQFVSFRRLPPLRGEERSWYEHMELSGGAALDWGVHAVDYVRYLTGLNVEKAQAFYCQRPSYSLALSSSFNFELSGGATMSMLFVCALGERGQTKGFDFTVFYEGGSLHLGNYQELEADGQVIFRGDEYDPWFEHDRRFIEAVRTGDRGLLLNDYHDGLYSLAPVLAGWESARRGGELIDVERFMWA